MGEAHSKQIVMPVIARVSAERKRTVFSTPESHCPWLKFWLCLVSCDLGKLHNFSVSQFLHS